MDKAGRKKIRVLYIQHHGTKGGAPTSLANLIKSFPKGSVYPYFLTPKGTVESTFRDITDEVYTVNEIPELTSIAGGGLFYLRLLKTVFNLGAIIDINRHIDRVKPDIIHLNDISLTLVAFFAKRKGYKIVMHARVVLSDTVPSLNRVIVKLARRYVDKVIAIDGSVANKLKDVANLEIIYNPLRVKSDEINKIIKKDPRKVCTILFLSNLLKYKGIFDLLKAAIILKAEGYQIRILIAGTNSRPDDFFESFKGRLLEILGIVTNVEKKVNRIIRSNSLNNVTLLGHVKDIDILISEIDILVFPSHMNGPSRSVFEAGAMGIPSIIALKDRLEDVVLDGKNGIIIGEKNPTQLAEAIKKLSSDSAMRLRLGENAKEHFNNLNDPKISARKVLDVYMSLACLN